MRKILWLCTLSLAVIATGCGDSIHGAERTVESAAERFIGYTPKRLSEYKTVAECATVVTQLEASRAVLSNICAYLFSEVAAAKPDFRNNLLCLRDRLEKADDFQQARNIVDACAKEFPSPGGSDYSSALKVVRFPTVEQQISQLKEAQEAEALARSTRDTAQEYNRRSRDIEQDHQRMMDKFDAENQRRMDKFTADNQRTLDQLSARANCINAGNTVNCN